MPVTPEQNPLFRKVILPWYDTDIACILTGVFMAFVFGFSLVGISVAQEIPDGTRHIWLPIFLLVLSVLGMVTVVVRLFRRHSHRFKKELP
jgi:fatty-acid desaturase